MKILAPVNKSEEVKKIVGAGADELYCGILTPEWTAGYSNVASCNRREWKTANLTGFGELEDVVKESHRLGAPVYLALNGLYTEGQFRQLRNISRKSSQAGIDGVIAADIGLIKMLKDEAIKTDIHASTGCTVFNSESARFFKDMGIKRINLPRHLRVSEIASIVKENPDMKFDVFILNSGCKNVDGLCTFQHGVNEVMHKGLWNIPKKMNLDRHILNAVRLLPPSVSRNISSTVFGVDSACLLNYSIGFHQGSKNFDRIKRRSITGALSSAFGLTSGIDTCGGCRIPEFAQMGIYALKIVGRNYSTSKKVKDVRFIREALSLVDACRDAREFSRRVRKAFGKIYGLPCRNLCYYPEETA